jgi:hypothetical protein
LLIEEGRTNLFSRSEEFNETAWLKLRLSISANSTVSPSGDNSADKLVEDASNNTHMVYRVLNTGSLVAHTFSVFAKADGRNFVYLDCGDGFPLNSNAYFNLSNGTLGTIGANATATITAFGNGWYRCSITATPTSTTTNGFYIQIASASGTRSYQGDGASGIFIWGAQVEAGSFATSYIPTTTGTLARSADVCSITGGDFNNFYNQSEGTLTVKVEEFRRGTSYNTVVEIFNGLSYSGNRLGVVFSGLRSGVTSPVEISLFSGGPAQYQTATTSTSSGYTAAIAYATDNVRGSLNGNLLAADTPPSNVNIGANTIRFGSIGIHIAAVRFYKKRLPNAKLQALTV